MGKPSGVSVNAGVAVNLGVAVKVGLASKVGRGLTITDVLVAVTTTGVSVAGIGATLHALRIVLTNTMLVKDHKTSVSIFSPFKVSESPLGNTSEDDRA